MMLSVNIRVIRGKKRNEEYKVNGYANSDLQVSKNQSQNPHVSGLVAGQF